MCLTVQEARKEEARCDGPAWRDGLSAGSTGAKRKPPLVYQRRAASWFMGYDRGAKWFAGRNRQLENHEVENAAFP